jgi:predicted signal transduction protein with EAL and GGDEF domain
VEAGRRLRSTLPPSAVVARLGADEFAVALGGISGAPSSSTARWTSSTSSPAPTPCRTAGPSSAPPASAPPSSTTPASDVGDVYREADLALYEAKDRGRNQCALFDDRLRARADARIEQESHLRTALDADGVRIFLQPITDLASGRTVGAEALARLRHPPAASSSRASSSTSPRKPASSSRSTRASPSSPSTPWPTSRTARERRGERLAAQPRLRRVRPPGERRPAPPRRPGRAPADRGHRAHAARRDRHRRRRAARLRRLGVRVGIDDFGTGYSALAYLGRFDLDFLKIDRSFVSGLGEDPRADTVVSAIVAIAHSHAMVVTAEGVESPSQAEALTKMGCDCGQGWHFGYPAPRTTRGRRGRAAGPARPS